MSRFIFYSSIFFGLVLNSNNSLSNYNDALDSYNNKNWTKSLKTCESNLEDFRCLNLLGVIYLNGLSVDKNYKKAKQYFLDAKDLGSKSAEFNLGWIALKGLGEKINLDAASKYFNNYNTKKFIVKSSNNSDASFIDNLVKLKKNNLISKYGYFYTNFIKLESLVNSKQNIEKKIITNILPIKNKLKQFENILIENNINIMSIKDSINREQEIIIKLLLLEINNNFEKFEKTTTQIYSFLQNFNIDNI
tara:strand:- start:2968 stop:3711 length:744 start_codon:yes stop_codon:yes gene_type:complete